MATLTVNGTLVSADDDTKKLLDFLRGDLGLVAAKNGCGEGACGTCTVLVDGKATRACVPALGKLEGKSVITPEGLSQREKDVYAFAFAEAGAVQCGFCIPGMVMSAKGLLDAVPSPTRAEVKKALRGNICRCTGYVKIENAVLRAADMLRDNLPLPEPEFSGRLGESVFRLDARDKTLGTAPYVDDITLEDMLYAKALRSKYPRARILSIDTARAEAHPDCVRVIRAEDIPGNKKCGHLVKDWDALFGVGEITRFIGDAVVLAVSRRRESLVAILDLVDVAFEELPPVTSPEQALAPGAPLLHEKGNLLREERLKRGDADGAIAGAAHVVTRHYSLPFTEHAFMEPECAIAQPDGDGVLLYTASQSIYDEQHEIASLLGLPNEKVNVRSQFVGGGFGGKEDMSVQHHAALAAWLLKRPVKVRLSRQESLMIHPKRHAMEIDCTTACDGNGKLLAAKFTIISDTGAYASLGGPVLQRACTHAGGPYAFENFEVLGRAVYTNNVPAGAFRGFGVTQSAFAMECNLNLLAEQVGISPWEIRYRNAVRPGQVLPNGQIADDSTGVVRCLEAVKEVYEQSLPYAGIASCFKNAGVGVGIADTGRCIISVEEGKLHIRSSAACIGQGMATVMLQMACERLGLPPSAFVVEMPDTRRTPDSGTTTASRQTLLTGEAVVRAAGYIRAELDAGASLADLEGREFFGEYLAETDPMGSDKPNPVSHVAYGYAAQVARLDESGKVLEVIAAYDVGRVVNPIAAEGQIEGGVAMGLGYGLTEDFPMDNGYVKAKYGTLGLFRAPDTPPIKVIIVNKDWYGKEAYGAKGVGELACIPTAPALQGAYYRLDGVFRTRLPLENTHYKKAKKQ